MWRHHPQKTSFLSLFGEFLFRKQGILDRIFHFQKTAIFRQKTNSYVAPMEWLRKMERQYETQFTTKIGGKN